MPDRDETMLFFNGIDGATGAYALPPLHPRELVQIISQEEPDEALLRELKLRASMKAVFHVRGDAERLDEVGWGIIFAYDDPQAEAIREALSPLLALRREQAGERYREYLHGEGYRPGESKNAFLARHGAGPGVVDPDKVPYYLLLIGGPSLIPYRFQFQLDVQHAVGRLDFETVEAYATYAATVVAAERGKIRLPKQAFFFGTANPDDPATALSSEHLVKPLVEAMRGRLAHWEIESVRGEAATKARLLQRLGAETPAFLFTAGHGMGFPRGDPRQRPHQGALLCQDWPGPRAWHGAIPQDFYVAGEDIGSGASLAGSMAFFFACYGAGTPREDQFAFRLYGDPQRAQIAERPFLAALPQRLLGHPRGGFLAVVGHVERAWGYAFTWPRAGEQTTTFEAVVGQVMEGRPVGLALDPLNGRYAEIAADLSQMMEDLHFQVEVDEQELVGLWTANNDARAYILLGDPAVRLPLAEAEATAIRPAVESVPLIEPRVEAATSEGEPFRSQGAGAWPTPTHAAGGGTEDELAYALRLDRESLGQTLRDFVAKVQGAIEETVRDLTSLEVITYTADDLEDVRYEQGGFRGGTLRKRALTRVAFDGDLLSVVPRGDAPPQALWEMHLAMVREAQRNRAEFLKVLGELAVSIVDLLKPG